MPKQALSDLHPAMIFLHSSRNRQGGRVRTGSVLHNTRMRLLRKKGISIPHIPIQAVSSVGVIAFHAALCTDERHDLVLSFSGNICIREYDLQNRCVVNLSSNVRLIKLLNLSQGTKKLKDKEHELHVLKRESKPLCLSTPGQYSVWHGCSIGALVIASP